MEFDEQPEKEKKMKRYRITIKYADQFSNWQWRQQSCSVYAESELEARLKTIDLYGLGGDCNYQILSVEEVG